jgi:Nucleotidyl transferase AbiEii toxin, Type IV TA system
MPVAELYRRQAALLVSVVPFVDAEKSFALKGGTAINLFVRDLPRISVDLDLTYLPVADRYTSLTAIDAAMRRISAGIAGGIRGARVDEVAPTGETRITKLNVRADGVQVQIEVTPVLRGCVYDPEVRGVSARVEEAFGFSEIQVVSFPDLYAARSSPRSIASIRAICSMCAIFWLTKASATSCGAPSSCTSSAPIALSPKSSRLRGSTSRRNLHAASTA